MTAKAKPVGFVLTSSVRNTIAANLTTVGDQGAVMMSLRDSFIKSLGNIKSLRGKPLPDADVDDIGDKVAAEYAKRVEAGTLKDSSVKPMVSDAKKIARCAPILATMEATAFRERCGNYGQTRKFCTALQKCDYKLADVPTTAGKADPVALTARSIKSILNGKGKHKFQTKGAKAALVLWAMRSGINLGTVGEEYFDRAEAQKFLGV